METTAEGIADYVEDTTNGRIPSFPSRNRQVYGQETSSILGSSCVIMGGIMSRMPIAVT